MRKTSLFSKKRGARGPLRFFAHEVQNNKRTQLLSNGLLIKLLGVVGITERGIYAAMYGDAFATELFGPAPECTTGPAHSNLAGA